LSEIKDQKLENSTFTAKKSYSLQDSFYLYEINSSSDWEIIPGIVGTGSEIDPYIIKDIIHNDEDHAFLHGQNSKAFVLFENCTFITWHYLGYRNTDLKFENCTNIEIDNCNFNSWSNGALFFSNSSQFKITNSDFHNKDYQISLINCSKFEISSSTSPGASEKQ